MLLNRSHLLLAGIPTGAALICLLWLKRRRTNLPLHHTDPGGSSSTVEQQIIKTILIDKEIESIEKHIISQQEELACEEIFDCENTEEKLAKVLDKFPDLTVSDSGEEEIQSKKLSSDNSLDNQLMFDTDLVESEEKITLDNKKINISKEEEKVEVAAEIGKELDNDRDATPAAESVQKVSEKEIVEPVLEKVKSLTLESTSVIKGEKEPSIASSPEVHNTDQNQIVEVKQEAKTTVVVETKESETTANMMNTETTQLAEKLADLEKKIREENGEAEQKVCTERDSANHSPSEVMLASPSISNFSDAHSEGSSDSGKGHSDVATSPSRTPAGGSSLAGDVAPSLYEFVLPQIIVGRLIGRRGTFLHEIRSSTSTNIYIKRHPDTNKLKICAIEGTQQDIDKALAKIRQKFPLRRFPQLTLEKVSFVNLQQMPPLKLEDFHLQLVESVNNDVLLSSLMTAAHFFLQQPSHPSYNSLSALNHAMNQIYSTGEAPTLDTPIKDAVCAAPTMGGWYRAQIVDVDEKVNTCTVRFLDYGGYLTLDSSSLRQIRADLLTLPFQAIECYLANVAPADELGWTEEAREFVHNLTVGQVLQAQIYDYAEDGTPLVYLYASFGSQVILINEELIRRGYGVLTSPQEE